LHGEAVAAGTVMAAEMSQELGIYIIMYIYVYIHMYIYVYIYMYVCIYTCIYIVLIIYIHISKYIHKHINTYIHKGWIDADLCQRIISLTKRAGLPIDLHNPYTEEELGIYIDIYKYSLRYT
jgi:3-dehydroquinate synthetase